MRIKDAESAIEAGKTTTSEIADHLDLDDTHVSRELKQYAEDGQLHRERVGRGYEYYIPADQNADPGSAGGSTDGSSIDPDREYDWDSFVPQGVPEYVATDGEYDEIKARIDHREEVDKPAHIRLTGPTGAGKTHLARHVAQELGAPLFDISVKWAIDTTDLLGRFVYVNEETRWVNGPLTKAILASKERPVVLLLDEINRARPESKAALFEALDDRAQVTLDGLGGVKIEGDNINLIVFSTMNVGQGHVVEELDLAEQRRLGPMWEVNYLGLNHPDREAALLTDRTPIHAGLAQSLVEAANDIRELAQDVGERVDRGVPTGLLIEWAKGAYVDALAGNSNPVMRSAQAEVIRAFFQDGDRDAPDREVVVSTLESHFDGLPGDAVLDENEWEAWSGETIEDELGLGNDPDSAL